MSVHVVDTAYSDIRRWLHKFFIMHILNFKYVFHLNAKILGNCAIWKRLLEGMLEFVTALPSSWISLTSGQQHMKQLYRQIYSSAFS